MSNKQQRVEAPRPEIGSGGLRVGRLTKPHGLKGGLKLELYTDNPELRFTEGAVFHLQVPTDSPWFGKTITMTALRWYNHMPVGFFDEVPDRTAAESIVRAVLWIDEADVEAGHEENAWYDQDLVGMQVIRDEVEVGIVAEVQHLPAHDLLVVKTPTGTVLVPFVEAIVPNVDVESRIITVTPPAGLFEELPEDASVQPAPTSTESSES